MLVCYYVLNAEPTLPVEGLDWVREEKEETGEKVWRLLHTQQEDGGHSQDGKEFHLQWETSL